MTEADARLTELEIALSYQDRVVEELGEIMRDQVGRLTRLETMMAALADRLATTEGRLDNGPPAGSATRSAESELNQFDIATAAAEPFEGERKADIGVRVFQRPRREAGAGKCPFNRQPDFPELVELDVQMRRPDDRYFRHPVPRVILDAARRDLPSLALAQNGKIDPQKSVSLKAALIGLARMTSREKDTRVEPAQVRALAAELALAGPLSVRRVADRLGISSRTLQRQLADQGVSLRGIVEEIRLEIARVLLCKTDLDVQEIAALTGYSTPSGLARAFARWTGRSPRTYRKEGARCAGKCTGWRKMGGSTTPPGLD